MIKVNLKQHQCYHEALGKKKQVNLRANRDPFYKEVRGESKQGQKFNL